MHRTRGTVVKFRVTALVLVGSMLIAGPLWARPLSDMLTDLVEKHDRILAAHAKAESARYRLNESWGNWLPSIEAYGEWTREEISVNQAGVEGTILERDEETIKITQRLLDMEKMFEVAYKDALYERARSEKEYVRQTMINEGVKAYLNAIQAYEKLVYARRSEERIKEQTGMEVSLVQKGAGLSSNVLQAKQQLAGAMALRVTVEGEMINSFNKFRSLFDEALDEDMVSSFKRPAPPFVKLPLTLDDAVARAKANNPRLRMAELDLVAAEKSYNMTYGNFLPRVNAFARGVRKNNDQGQEVVRTETNLGLEWRWTLFDGGSSWYDNRAARSDVTQARHTMLNLHRTLEEKLRVAWENLLTFRSNAEFLKNQANILGEFLELAKKERLMGNRSLLDVLQAEVSYINAISSAVAAEVDTMIAAYDILYVMGELDLGLFMQ